MTTVARKAVQREYMRQRRADPVFRAAELEKNREYQRTHRETVRLASSKWKKRQYSTSEEYRASAIAQSKENYRRLRDRLFEGYGNKCACCSEPERDFLELDHIEGGGSKHFASFKSPVNLYREVILAGFPPIYRLLCANCNRGRQRNGGSCPHTENDWASIIAGTVRGASDAKQRAIAREV